MNLKSPIFLEHLDDISRNVPCLSFNIKYDNGKTYIEVSEKDNRYALVFPRYGMVKDRIKELQRERNVLFTRYRFLRTKLLFDAEVSSSTNLEYDNIVRQLNAIDANIDIFESYIKVLNNATETETTDLINTKKLLEKDIIQACNSNDNAKYLAILKSIHDKDETLKNIQDNQSETFIERLPRKIQMTQEYEENDKKQTKKKSKKKKDNEEVKIAKKRGRPPKPKEGGRIKSMYIDDEKLKTIVKRRMKKN